jgi:hypothetical protein
MVSVEACQHDVNNRSSEILKHKLSFFDDAPMVKNDVTDPPVGAMLSIGWVTFFHYRPSSKWLAHFHQNNSHISPMDRNMYYRVNVCLVVSRLILWSTKNTNISFTLSNEASNRTVRRRQINEPRNFSLPFYALFVVSTQHYYHQNSIVMHTTNIEWFEGFNVDWNHWKAVVYIQTTKIYREL